MKQSHIAIMRPTVVEVSLDVIESNFKRLKSLANGALIMSVVKANAYGHGIVPVAKVLDKAGTDYFGVAFIEEAIELRNNQIKKPILVMGGLFDQQIEDFLNYDVDLTVSSLDKLRAVEEVAAKLEKKAKVHLKVDTGMERVGVHHYSADKLFREVLNCKWIDIIGVYSHFVESEVLDSKLTKLQLEIFKKSSNLLEEIVGKKLIKHLSNSAGILLGEEYHLDLVRPGAALYGVYPSKIFKNKIDLTPALSLKSKIVYFKVIRDGVGVSYNHQWVSKEQTRVVTIPVGYGDGFTKQLSNKIEVLIKGKRYKQIGSICMDQFMVDLGPKGEAYNGDEVVLIGKQGAEQITVEDLAEKINTDPREILVLINNRIPRQYV